MMINTTIDWTQPLEAVNSETGEVVPVSRAAGYGDFLIKPHLSGGWWAFNENGRHDVDSCPWRVRNVASPAEDEWGPEIKVDGKRPEWLGDDAGSQKIAYTRENGETYGLKHITFFVNDAALGDDGKGWRTVTAIRLPANHPHYRTHSPATPPLSLSTGVDRVERMEALVRRMAGNSSMGEPYEEDRVITYNSDHYCEARAIATTLPPLPDPDLVKAREIATEYSIGGVDYTKGDLDESGAVRLALAGIKAGREMGR